MDAAKIETIKDLKDFLLTLPADCDTNKIGFRMSDDPAQDKHIGLVYIDVNSNELAITEGYVLPYDDIAKKEVNEDGEGAGVGSGDAFSGPDSVNGMGAPTLASRGVDGSGDVSSVATKKKKRIMSFTNFFTR